MPSEEDVGAVTAAAEARRALLGDRIAATATALAALPAGAEPGSAAGGGWGRALGGAGVGAPCPGADVDWGPALLVVSAGAAGVTPRRRPTAPVAAVPSVRGSAAADVVGALRRAWQGPGVVLLRRGALRGWLPLGRTEVRQGEVGAAAVAAGASRGGGGGRRRFGGALGRSSADGTSESGGLGSADAGVRVTESADVGTSAEDGSAEGPGPGSVNDEGSAKGEGSARAPSPEGDWTAASAGGLARATTMEPRDMDAAGTGTAEDREEEEEEEEEEDGGGGAGDGCGWGDEAYGGTPRSRAAAMAAAASRLLTLSCGPNDVTLLLDSAEDAAGAAAGLRRAAAAAAVRRAVRKRRRHRVKLRSALRRAAESSAGGGAGTAAAGGAGDAKAEEAEEDEGHPEDAEEARAEAEEDAAARAELRAVASRLVFVALKRTKAAAVVGRRGAAQRPAKWVRRLVEVDADRQTVQYFAVEETGRIAAAAGGVVVLDAGEVASSPGGAARDGTSVGRGWGSLGEAEERGRSGSGLFAVGLVSPGDRAGWWVALDSPQLAAAAAAAVRSCALTRDD